LHLFPDLVRLEKKYAKQLVVIGVHTPKFDAEKNAGNVRKAMLRYELHHPVVNDADCKIGKAYQGTSWPTVYLIDPEGNLVGRIANEKIYEVMDKALGQLIKVHRARKTLNEDLLPFQTAARKKSDSPLLFPGKVLADPVGKRLFISDSTHHRIVITDLEGRKIAIAGTGTIGRTDGAFAKAQFSDPQGLALSGQTLYVADRMNNLIRALNLKTQTVSTVAGTSLQGVDKARAIGLNSPWGLLMHNGRLFIGMAGHHQIWVMDLAGGTLAPFAGVGAEELADGPRFQCAFAQPSGLGSDGQVLYVADSESSAIRALALNGSGIVKTIVGKGLFTWGDQTGIGDEVRLQHPLDVVHHEGKLYFTDTLNHKIKILDPLTRACTTLPVEEEDGSTTRHFDEPAGLSVAGDDLYVADTNADRIRVVNLKTNRVSTLRLQGVDGVAK
jgi:DNA-binding beta-propeller fold protein YncE